MPKKKEDTVELTDEQLDAVSGGIEVDGTTPPLEQPLEQNNPDTSNGDSSSTWKKVIVDNSPTSPPNITINLPTNLPTNTPTIHIFRDGQWVTDNREGQP